MKDGPAEWAKSAPDYNLLGTAISHVVSFGDTERGGMLATQQVAACELRVEGYAVRIMCDASGRLSMTPIRHEDDDECQPL